MKNHIEGPVIARKKRRVRAHIMAGNSVSYPLENIATNFYKIGNIEKVNYAQLIQENSDSQWCIQAELILRKENPKALVALFSRDLWCFSLNDEPLPFPSHENGDEARPKLDKKGHFTPDVPKPNLPTPYAVFLKALRRMVYVNLCLNSKESLVPFGNLGIYSRGSWASRIISFEPHLIESGELCLSMDMKEIPFVKLDAGLLRDTFLTQSAVYLAPSGIRAFFATKDPKDAICAAPKNAKILLITLLLSYGIDLTRRSEITWVNLIASLDHLNGQTSKVSRYLETPKTYKKVVWPLELCYAQMCSGFKPKDEMIEGELEPDLDEVFEIIDDFVQLKLTSAFRTPGSAGTGTGTGTATGYNPLSTGAAYSDNTQLLHKHSNSIGPAPTSNINIPQSNSLKTTPNELGSNITPAPPPSSAPPSADDQFQSAFLNSPHLNGDQLDKKRFNYIKHPNSDNERSDAWLDKEKSNIEAHQSDSPAEQMEKLVKIPNSEYDNDKPSEEDDMGLLGDADDEELFGEHSDTDDIQKQDLKDITDDMFELAQDSATDSPSDSPRQGAFDHSKNLKRKYLDIPLEEMTLPTTPLYTDPGAPLPVETPKDRKKSVFAPLNFNPIIESNVDNKYRNGGKFSIDTRKSEEPLKFDVSTANISSSEDGASMSEEDEFGDLIEDRINSQSFDVGMISIPAYQGDLQDRPPEFARHDFSKEASFLPPSSSGLSPEKLMKDGQRDLWKSPRDAKNGEISIPPGNIPPPSEAAFDNCDYLKDGDGICEEGQDVQATEEEKTLLHQTNEAATSGPVATTNRNSDSEIGSQESSNTLPFLLRSVALNTIPRRFYDKCPTTSIEGVQSVLNLLTEQIVFDKGLLKMGGSEDSAHDVFKSCEEGFVQDSLKNIFGLFDRVYGDKIIDEIFYMKQPLVQVKKNSEVIKIKADSESFAQYLNLKPVQRFKCFKALFLTTSFKDDCTDFLSVVSQTYTAQELGFCELVKLTDEDIPGLIHLINFERDTLSLLSAQIVSYCSRSTRNTANVPLMLFLPLDSVDIFSIMYMTLKFNLIKVEVVSKLPKVELYLKLIPTKFIRSPLTSVNDYNDLCTGLYNSLPPLHIKFTVIAKSLPEKITFKTTQGNDSHSFSFKSFLHLAYARSVDKNWLCAAWTSSSGDENIVRTWYTGNSKSAFENSCNQMWQTTLKFAATKCGRICLVLTRLDNVLPDDELMNWRRLSSTSKNLHLAVVCVGESSNLTLLDEDKSYPSFKPIFRDIDTSISLDSNALDKYQIVKISNEVHGVIFQHPLQLLHSLHRCPIINGALVKFKPGEGDDFVEKLDVNLLNCPHSDSRNLLKSILEEFRNLAALSAWFGVSQREKEHIPWHILAVAKMMKFVVHIDVSNCDV
ncbi:LAMI_0G11188g1_1 [Lachancea mirantina]|uniref:Mediator of RNA polymerase II transcription subunit 13 n=1 Tax=Lachancea mirantina TaxID=1230905 RepID=A0A1G4KAX4_9SACH|nr:LAMI_0G11188g1_1 [Lachancea mirantina]